MAVRAEHTETVTLGSGLSAPKDIEQILSAYQMSMYTSKEELEAFISENPELCDLLRVVPSVLSKFVKFQGLKLRVMEDMEYFAARELILHVMVQGDIDEIEDQMERFCETWWLDRPEFKSGKIIITTAYC